MSNISQLTEWFNSQDDLLQIYNSVDDWINSLSNYKLLEAIELSEAMDELDEQVIENITLDINEEDKVRYGPGKGHLQEIENMEELL